MTRRPQITRRWEGYKRAESGFCPELCCSGEAVSHTSDVHVTPLWEDADTERYHGQKAPLGSISLKEKHLLGSTEQIQFHPSFPTFCSSFVAVQGLSLVTKHTLQSTQASVFVAHKLSCPVECEIFLDQGSNLCPLHWHMDS